MTHAYIIDAVRRPRGRGSDTGALKAIQSAPLLARTLQGLKQRQALDTVP